VTYPWLQAVESEFAERLKGGRLAHALLLSGPAESGKVELAEKFLASALCLEDSYPACGACRSCQLASSGAHPDGHVVTFEENPRTGVIRKELVIDQVRRLTASLYLTNTISRRKAALVYPVEAMNKHTSNALLKTLEEPPGETVLILVSHDPVRLPATIRSRCQGLEVRLPGRESALAWLREQPDFEQQEAEKALQAAAGSPIRALRMLGDGGVEQYASLTEMLDGLLSGSRTAPQAMAELSEVDPDRLWSWISLRTAAATRVAAGQVGETKALSILQQQADRNRSLARTQVRKDLLLQDWLIQWARLNA
jgi:DNA polymerase-3 subunit delta'